MLTASSAAVLVVSLILSPAFGHVQDDGFCRALSSVVSEAPKKFRGVRGPISQAGRIVSQRWYESTAEIPGGRDCMVLDLEDYRLGVLFTCTFYAGDDQGAATKAFEQLRSAVLACPGVGALKSERSEDEQGRSLKYFPRAAAVEVKLTKGDRVSVALKVSPQTP